MGGPQWDYPAAVGLIRELSVSEDLAGVGDFSSVGKFYADLQSSLSSGADCSTLVARFGGSALEVQQAALDAKYVNLAKGSALAAFSGIGAASRIVDVAHGYSDRDAAGMLGLEVEDYLDDLSSLEMDIGSLAARIVEEGLGPETDWKTEEESFYGKTAEGRRLLAHELVHIAQQRAASGQLDHAVLSQAAFELEEIRGSDQAVIAAKRAHLHSTGVIHRDLAARFSSVSSCESSASTAGDLLNALKAESETRETLSDAAKIRHDTSKNAIGNIRA